MTRYVALLRGVNVGGRVVKMDRLRKVFESLGSVADVTTFIASGNVLFSSTTDPARLEKKSADALRSALGYDVAVFVRSADEISRIAAYDAFGAAELANGSLFVGFLPDAITPREKKIIASLESPVDKLHAYRREIYWRANQNFSGAVFQPARLEKALGKPATFRNVSTVRKIAGILTTACLVVALGLSARASPQLPTLPPVDVISYRGMLVRDWVAALLRHTPGQNDEALTVVRRWGAENLREAWINANILMALLKNPNLKTFSLPLYGRSVPVAPSRPDLEALKKTAADMAARYGRDGFLKRAALLHTDIAIVNSADPERAESVSSFLFARRVVVRSGDGQQKRIREGDVNWEFARILLAGVADLMHDEDVLRWYRATLALRLVREELDVFHFEDALKIFPADPEVLFLEGCLHEAFADPRVQTLMDNVDVPRGITLDVRSERAELREATDLFRRALARDPSHAEARLRYGRTLGRLGRHQEALSHLRRAIEGTSDPLLSYYAQLFAGSEEETLGRHAAARDAYEQAARLFPRAQAPRMALSELAHRTGDRAGARAALAGVLHRSDKEPDDDPWWQYRATPGRDADDRMGEVYQSVAGGVRP